MVCIHVTIISIKLLNYMTMHLHLPSVNHDSIWFKFRWAGCQHRLHTGKYLHVSWRHLRYNNVQNKYGYSGLCFSGSKWM